LYWARSQTGNVTVSKTKIQLNKTISEILLLYKSSLDNKNITPILDIPDSCSIYFDEFMFNTVIRNLLSNAIKFSYYDSKITLKAIEEENSIIFSIEDDGMGISDDNLKKLFDEGSNYKAVGTDNEKGTGLGLILCRDFANENDAKIKVSSVIDKGTTFELILQKA
jgi:signal transduction histidine kinase